MARKGNQVKEDKGKSVLQEIKDFVLFLSSLWGLLTGISVLFPYSNILIKAIPLEMAQKHQIRDLVSFSGHGLTHLTPEFITAVTTIAIVFLVLWRFVIRFDYMMEGEKKGRNALGKYSLASFICGVVMLMIYWAIYWKIEASFLVDFILLFLYIGSFCCITDAFMRLSMIEYFEIGIPQCGSPGHLRSEGLGKL